MLVCLRRYHIDHYRERNMFFFLSFPALHPPLFFKVFTEREREREREREKEKERAKHGSLDVYSIDLFCSHLQCRTVNLARQWVDYKVICVQGHLCWLLCMCTVASHSSFKQCTEFLFYEWKLWFSPSPRPQTLWTDRGSQNTRLRDHKHVSMQVRIRTYIKALKQTNKPELSKSYTVNFSYQKD